MLVLINAHGANNSALKYTTRELLDEVGMAVIYFSCPDLDEVIAEHCESPTWHGMIHACEFESSMMLALKPELVNMEKAVREYPPVPDLYGKSAISLGELSMSGVFGDPTLASEDKGRQIIDHYVQSISETIITAYTRIKAD